MIELAPTRRSPAPELRLIRGGASRAAKQTWWERRATMRQLVGGCPDHWWSMTARTTARCTCDRFAG